MLPDKAFWFVEKLSKWRFRRNSSIVALDCLKTMSLVKYFNLSVSPILLKRFHIKYRSKSCPGSTELLLLPSASKLDNHGMRSDSLKIGKKSPFFNL